jgi:hypothetical protein
MKGLTLMSKTKNWLWDEAENFVDSVIAKIKSGEITKDQGSDIIKQNTGNYALELVGIEHEDQIDDMLYYALGGQ